jgi:HSP20 family protein
VDIKDLMTWKWPRPVGGEGVEAGESLKALQADINRAFEGFWRSFSPRLHVTASVSLTERVAPLIDVAETETGVEIVADLPGFEESEIEVAVGEDFVEIKAEKKGGSGELSAHTLHLRERPPRVAQRLVSLPAPVEQEKVTATYCNGVLTVVLAKAVAERKPSIRIEVAKG